MPWFKKKSDPISDRARALNEEIAALEAQIKKLGTQRQPHEAHPRLRSTAVPHGPTVPHSPEPASPPAKPETRNPFTAPPASKPETRNPKPETRKSAEPIFEEVDQNRLKSKSEVATPEHFNDLGVRKYDLPALLRRIKNHFRGPSTTNPKLVSYLAAGGVQGLRPMRYEKRVARNRFIVLVIFLFLMGLGIFLVFVKHH